jgi:hypothetical protein
MTNAADIIAVANDKNLHITKRMAAVRARAEMYRAAALELLRQRKIAPGVDLDVAYKAVADETRALNGLLFTLEQEAAIAA